MFRSFKLGLFITLPFIFALSGCSIFKNLFDNRPRPEVQKVLIRGGSFMMGDVVEGENSDALPTHTVILDDYYLTKYEITYAQYDLFANHSKYPRLHHIIKIEATGLSFM